MSVVTGNKSDMPTQEVAPEEGMAYATQVKALLLHHPVAHPARPPARRLLNM